MFDQIDHDIVDLVYRQDRLVVISDSRRFFWAEMSSDKKNAPTIRNAYWSKAARHLHQTPLNWYDSESLLALDAVATVTNWVERQAAAAAIKIDDRPLGVDARRHRRSRSISSSNPAQTK